DRYPQEICVAIAAQEVSSIRGEGWRHTRGERLFLSIGQGDAHQLWGALIVVLAMIGRVQKAPRVGHKEAEVGDEGDAPAFDGGQRSPELIATPKKALDAAGIATAFGDKLDRKSVV